MVFILKKYKQLVKIKFAINKDYYKHVFRSRGHNAFPYTVFFVSFFLYIISEIQTDLLEVFYVALAVLAV